MAYALFRRLNRNDPRNRAFMISWFIIAALLVPHTRKLLLSLARGAFALLTLGFFVARSGERRR